MIVSFSPYFEMPFGFYREAANARYQRRAQDIDDEKGAQMRVGCMPLLERSRTLLVAAGNPISANVSSGSP